MGIYSRSSGMSQSSDGLDHYFVDPHPQTYLLNDNFIDKIEKLEELAYDYNNGDTDVLMKYSISKEYWLAFMFIRQFNDDYVSGTWSSVGGIIDGTFVDYVLDENKELYDYFSQITTIYSNEYGEVADLRHLAATATVYIYKTDLIDSQYYDYEAYSKFYHVLSNVKTLFNNTKTVVQTEMFEYHLDNLGGWAGDLQTLMNDTVEITKQTKDSNNYDEFYNTFYEIIGSYSFTMVDLYADTDAYNIYMLLYCGTSNSLTEAFKEYYFQEYKCRFSSFTNYWDEDKISDLVYT